MIWAQWGLKDKLVADPDVMLCHQCGDCTARCPRGAKPGDVLGAIRAYAYTHFGFPQGLARLASDGKNWPLLVGMPAAIIFLAFLITGGYHIPAGELDFGNFFGHGMILGFTQTVIVIDLIFLPAFLFAAYAAYRGVSAMWKKMAEGLGANPQYRPSAQQFVVEFLWPAIVETVKHKRFNECGTNKNRVNGHLPLLLSFIGLFIVTNYAFVRKDIVGLAFPSMHGPLALMDPFKLLANISAIALIAGVGILWANRAKMEEEKNVTPTFYDWFLIAEIMAVGVSGLSAELLRLIDVPVLAYFFYGIHLVAVLMLFFYMPYTKFAHMVYRTFAMAFERYRDSRFVQGRS
jgi:quinone-modifying oxidoreductase subunit QmoC